MKIFMLWRYYDDYLDYFYKKNPVSHNETFEELRDALFNDHFGWPAELASYMNGHGYDVEFIIENAEVMQKKWALENNFSDYSMINWKKNIVLAQIKKFNPHILWIPNPSVDHSYKYIDGARGYYTKLAYYLGHDISNKELIMRADILFVINEKYVKSLYPSLNNIVYMGVGFSPAINSKLGLLKKNNDIVFVGSVTPSHKKRAEILSFLINNGLDIKIYGGIVSVNYYTKLRGIAGDIVKRKNIRGAFNALLNLFKQSDYERNVSILEPYCKNPVFGMDYYHTIASSKICLNIHIDLAKNFSGNMRMFEATGVNTCLVTDKKENNSLLFDVGHEVIEFSDKKDLLEKVLEISNVKIRAISKSGQDKTLNNYSIEKLFSRIKNHL
jgi:spore maturation protein CgeB